MSCFRKLIGLVVLALIFSFGADAQPDRWQQRIAYQMEVNLNSTNHRLTGKQKIAYTNNSPDTLHFIYIHLYWNAFKPNSSMDERSRELGTKVIGRNPNGSNRLDWDGRVKDRIQQLLPDEEGFCNLQSISLQGRPQKIELFETIAKIYVDKPILPKSTVNFETTFEAQVPVQIRRSGRNNAEGVAYSMSQWYPKISEYDYQGWHPTPYIAREFYGVWGDYDVKINLHKDLKVAATGELQNATAIGFGYDKPGTALKPISVATRTWHFKGKDIHDFVWAADADYSHIVRQTENGPTLHFFYKSGSRNDELWAKTADSCALSYPIIKANFGAYPWPVYSFIQGGDGGMEYAMATLLKSHSLGTAIHEWMHSWYQQLMGSNEGLYAWMDEGFTSFAESFVINRLKGLSGNPWQNDYAGYISLARSRFEEPMSTHADHFATNFAYGRAAYSKGATFLGQLGYLLGDSLLFATLKNYYNEWQFKHPNPNDFIRVAEKTSGAELDWYKEYMVYTTKTIDYAVDSVWNDGSATYVRIKRLGEMPMPVEVSLSFKDGAVERHYLPLNLMYWNKTNFGDSLVTTTYPAQRWTHRLMTIATTRKLFDLSKVEIDAAGRMADIDRRNNVLELNW